ncbi:protein MAINTENANCE OF PSII UNDER HIGH LIGHT 1 [Prosopis cineraria]|uniref:protein MAINTENANCE OF PSII UNDER HIGH LIGHT 1 n=1 Tax=Prosopis cineraria TaxID=364024 RepID=UPI0024104F81|nr:protein MAINTENANCE OF PSII UNDER HIGH LIGHT 1 [Prosopis cineraria]
MACALQATLAANSCAFSNRRFFMKHQRASKRSIGLFTVRASSDDDDCNEEECAPEKEVGKISVEWLAGDRTKVVGTFPPKKRGWTGYVEKDTAGQTNIYSVEPAVYVAESAISSGSAGSSSDGSENTAALAAGLALVSVAAASSILLQVGKNTPAPVQAVGYSGPSLGYYINKFKPPELVQASVPSQTEELPSTSQTEELPAAAQLEGSLSEAPQVQAQTSSENVVS